MLIVNAIFLPQGEGKRGKGAAQMQRKSRPRSESALPARPPACLAVFSPPLTRVAGSGTGYDGNGNGDSVSGFNDA